MKYRKLGNCGSSVSVIGFGSWLTVGGSVDAKTGSSLIKYAFDKGINFFDTADVYSSGESEKFLGKTLSAFRRRDLFIASKCYWPMSDNVNDKGLSRKHIFESVHESLRNLKTDYLDLYQCHRYDSETPVEETCRAFYSLIEQGKILYWGVSEWTKNNISEAVNFCRKSNLHEPVSNQPQYSLLYRDIENNGVMDYCKKNGIGLVVWSPLAQGVLTGKYNKKKEAGKDTRLGNDKYNVFVKKLAAEENLKKVEMLMQISADMNTTASCLSLAWCLRKGIVSSAITSATKLNQLKENIKASEIIIPADVIEKLDEIFKIEK
ncbi:MAG TPA: aldo/keto reductase family protein [Ignavibacteria bacterium]|nr:aldo/keto reductase family protein [Ignavibacteria bacterium]